MPARAQPAPRDDFGTRWRLHPMAGDDHYGYADSRAEALTLADSLARYHRVPVTVAPPPTCWGVVADTYVWPPRT